MTIEETIKRHFADLMWELSVLETKLEMAYARIKELEAAAVAKPQDS